MNRFRIVIAACFAALGGLALAAPAHAAAYMKLGDIKGEATSKDHKGWIVIESMASPPSRSTATRRLGAKPEVNLKAILIGLSEELKAAAAAGRTFQSAQIEVVNASGERYLTITLQNVSVVGLRPGSTSAQPTEELSLNFEKMTLTYDQGAAKGGNVEFEWKVEEGES